MISQDSLKQSFQFYGLLSFMVFLLESSFFLWHKKCLETGLKNETLR